MIVHLLDCEFACFFKHDLVEPQKNVSVLLVFLIERLQLAAEAFDLRHDLLLNLFDVFETHT